MSSTAQRQSDQVSRTCVDANLALRRVIPYERDAAVEEIWAEWERHGTEVVGPMLLYAEATSTLRLGVVAGRLTEEQGEAAFRDFNQLGIRKIDRDDLHVRAWELAQRHPVPGAGVPSGRAAGARILRAGLHSRSLDHRAAVGEGCGRGAGRPGGQPLRTPAGRA